MTEYSDEDKEELFNERAGIYEFDAHESRLHSERVARAWMIEVWNKRKPLNAER